MFCCCRSSKLKIALISRENERISQLLLMPRLLHKAKIHKVVLVIRIVNKQNTATVGLKKHSKTSL